jgi:hypothetical protein
MSCPGCETIAQPVELRLTPATAAVTAEQPRDSGLRDAEQLQAGGDLVAKSVQPSLSAFNDRRMNGSVFRRCLAGGDHSLSSNDDAAVTVHTFGRELAFGHRGEIELARRNHGVGGAACAVT